jgi:hypothetical protein
VSAFTDWLSQKFPGTSQFVEKDVLPTLGKVMESPLGVPLIVADKIVNELYRRPVATALTVAQGVQSKDFISPREAYNLTDREALPGLQITPGQAASTFLGQNLLANPLIKLPLQATNVDEKIYKMVPFLNPEFNIEERDERKAAYKDAFWGSVITGTADIAFELAGAKGVGAGVKAAKLGTGVTRSAAGPKFLDSTRANVISGRDAYKAQGSPTDIKNFRAPNGDSVWVFDILNSKTGTDLLKNPIFRDRPDLADLAAKTQTWEEAAGFYLMAQGDTLAARALQQTAPSVADAYKEITKAQKLRPLTPDELEAYQVVPAPKRAKELSAIFDDLVERSPEYKAVVKEFSQETAGGIKTNPVWAPSQYSFLEKFRLNKATVKNLRLTGKGADDITENIIGGGVFRPFVYLGMRSLEQKPLNYLSLSSTRAMEATEEMSAWMISSPVLRKMANSPDPKIRKSFLDYKEITLRGIRRDMNNETALMLTIKQAEKTAMQMIVKEIARQKGIKTNIKVDDVADQIIMKRDAVRRAAVTAELLEDQQRGMAVKLSDNLKSKLADSVPLVDLDRFTLGAAREIDGASALTNAGRSTPRNVTLSFEGFNSLFSTSVLVRPGYIPKNSMFEPSMRFMAETGSFIDLEYAIPGMVNWARNIGSGLDAKVVAPFSKEATKIRNQRKQAVEAKKNVIEGDIPNIEKQLVVAKQEAKDLGTRKAKAEVRTLEKALVAAREESSKLEGLVASLSGDLENFFATRKGPKATFLDDDITLKVLGTRIKEEGLFTGPGGRASLADVDATQAVLNSVGATRALASATETKVRMTVKPGTKNYWAARAELTEKLRANDGSFRLALEGKSPQEIAKSLMADYKKRGNKSDLYRLAVSKRLDDIDSGSLDYSKIKPTIEDARFFGLEATEEVQKLLPDDGVRAIALQRPVTVKELKARYENQADLPEVSAIVPIENLGAATKMIERYNKIASAAFRQLVKPEVRLWRNPLAAKEGKKALEALYSNAMAQGIVVDGALYNQFRQIARRYATRRVEDTFYQVRRFNNAQFYSRFIIGFSTAMFNSLRFWTKAGLNNPYQFALLEQIRTMPWDVGTVVGEKGEMVNKTGYLINDQGQYVSESGTVVGRQDAVLYDGETYLALPYYEDIWAKVQGKPGYEGLRPYNKKVNTRMFNFLVNGPNPVWWAQVALGGVLVSNPELEPKIQKVLDWDGQGTRRFGDLVFSGRPAISFRPTVAETTQEGFLFFVPRWAREAWDLGGVSRDKFFGEGGPGEDLDPTVNDRLAFRRDRFTDTLWYVHMARRFNEESEDPNAVVDIKTSEDLAYGIMVNRFLERLFSPLGVTYQPTSQMFQDERIKLVKYYSENPELRKGLTPDDAATSDLIAKHGVERVGAMFGLTTGSRERPGGGVVSQEELKAITSNREIVENFLRPNPKERISSLPIITYTPTPGEFSDVAYAAYDALSLAGIKLTGEKRTFAERAAEAETRQGWFEYSKLVAARDAELASRWSQSMSARSNRDIERRFKDDMAKLRERLPAWGDIFGDSKRSFDQNTNFIEEILNSDAIEKMDGPKRQMWEQVAVWHSEYREAKDAYDSISTSDTRRRERFRDFWENRTSQLRLENTYFADFHSRWLSGDEIIDVNELLKRELPEAVSSITPARPSQPGFTMGDVNQRLGSLLGGRQ